ncbi:peptide chain release factor N(5)-glutamine methyltransferase [Senegalia massiliensis]|uniref:peptide chain release factor N(5)-glutamine methyltransferase n=1 Tax=Senegalia massiliensis TaxID=1720316 RepID=UPI0010317E8E|nr:peptide chain release factor N(5)-glutamine methyltransferase [Senegalia massiliensis]
MSTTVRDLLERGFKSLSKTERKSPRLESELIVMHLLDVDKAYLYTHPNRIVSKEIIEKFEELIEKRKEGYPIQYILKNQEFMGLDFHVTEGVLVPRPDTEILIEYIIKFARKNKKEKIKILDIGTGSGAISLSLAYYIENSYIYSVDISEKAIKIARKNKKKMNLEDRVELITKDILEGFPEIDEKMDIVVSNPPYIPSRDIDSLQIEVSKYEPRLALDGGDDGLVFYRYITEKAKEKLIDNGLLCYEIGYDQGESVKNIMGDNGYKEILVLKDLQGRDRAVIGRMG